jgi:hypothetical protein
MGRLFLCFLGWLFVLATMGAGAWEVFAPAAKGGIAMRPLGAFWYWIDPGSLNLVQAVVERYLLPELWDPVIVAVLQQPAVFVLAVPAFVLLALCLIIRLWRRWRTGV